jgi:hypothetical protein
VPAPVLTALRLGDDEAVWAGLGFATRSGRCRIGAVELELEGSGGGILGWAFDGTDVTAAIDGIPTERRSSAAGPPPEHPNGALRLDHVVVATPDLERTLAALGSAGLDLRRVRDAQTARQGFFRAGEAIVEVVGPRTRDGDGPARLWGLVVVVEDLDALGARLGETLGTARAAVQPGRRIATVSREAGLGTAVAFMTPHRKPGD